MSDHFDDSEFFGDSGEVSPSDHFESSHSPALGYTHIEKSLASLDAGLDEFDSEEERVEAEIYANVTVFREVMQYLEEFGIYLYSRLDPDVDFVEAVTGTRPRQVKEIFESIRDGELDDVVDDYQPNTSGDDWLKEQLGYDKLEAGINDISLDDIDTDDKELSVDTIEDAITGSLDAVRGHLRLIAEFFVRFDEPYNAVKHGNRVFPKTGFEMTMSGLDGETDIEIDEEFVSFLCKTTGDRRGGDLYTFIVPVRILREQSVSTVKLARNLYTQMYEIKQKVAESQRTGEEVTLNPNFYDVSESGGGGTQFTLKSIRNPDTAIWLPEGVFPEGFEEYEMPVTTQVAVGIHRRGNDMVVETEGNRSPSYDYPIMVDLEMAGDENHLLGMAFTQNFSFKLYQLPLWQYFEFLSLQEIEPIEEVTIEISSAGETVPNPTDGPVSLPDLPDPQYPEILEYMRNVGRAADSEIWIPMLWPPGIPHVIGHYLENYDLTRDIAQELLNVIDELTEDQIATIPEVGIIDAESYDDGVYQIVKHQDLRFKMDGLHLMEDEETGAVEFSFVSGAHPGYERHEEGDVDGLGLMYLEETAGEAFDVFLESGIDAVIELTPVDDPEESNSVLEFKREYGPKYTWYHLDKFHFTLSSELPPHLEQAQDCSDDGTF